MSPVLPTPATCRKFSRRAIKKENNAGGAIRFNSRETRGRLNGRVFPRKKLHFSQGASKQKNKERHKSGRHPVRVKTTGAPESEILETGAAVCATQMRRAPPPPTHPWQINKRAPSRTPHWRRRRDKKRKITRRSDANTHTKQNAQL